MTEEFVTFEIAKKLKEEGYNKPFYFYYRTDDECIHHVNTCAPLVYSDKIDDEVVIAPTISQVLKWLREEKAIFVEVSVNNHTGFDFYFTIYEKSEECWIVCGFNKEWYDTYEVAAIAGIEYCLDNLI